MSMNAEEFLELAKRLLTNEQCPAGFRTLISRGYYAAFHVAKSFIESTGFTFPSRNTEKEHQKVQDIFGSIGDGQIELIGKNLFDLHGHRKTADYKLDNSHIETLRSAQERLKEARHIVDTLKACVAKKGKGEHYDKIASTVHKKATEIIKGVGYA